ESAHPRRPHMGERIDDEDDRRRDGDRPRRRRDVENTRVPCPKCGAKSVRSGPWPWYLGTVGAIMCRAVICNECGHEYDEKKPHANRRLVQDFVIYGHSDLPMTRKLLEREPALLNAAMDWGAGDWETALGGASHMGRRDIAGYLLEQGARIDLFCAAMMG